MAPASSMRTSLSRPSHLPEASSLNTIALGVRFPHINLGKDTDLQTITEHKKQRL